jgi:hypothetical protein
MCSGEDVLAAPCMGTPAHEERQTGAGWLSRIRLQRLSSRGATASPAQVHDYTGVSMLKLSSGIKAATKKIIRLFQAGIERTCLPSRPQAACGSRPMPFRLPAR